MRFAVALLLSPVALSAWSLSAASAAPAAEAHAFAAHTFDEKGRGKLPRDVDDQDPVHNQGPNFQTGSLADAEDIAGGTVHHSTIPAAKPPQS
ncbi:MAG: hypothetical protein ACRC20_14480 [Segniliparus sp.]|uniref:hypothetical protein n=1 Tax=Segniliparus sp. TaxID=2804064 RepID=UPI003F2E85BA